MSTIKTIDEMFRWRLGAVQCKSLNIPSIAHKSVEETNEEFAINLGWTDHTDVLYSFLLTYKLGLEIINEKKFNELATEYMEDYKEKYKLCRLNTNSPRFLYYCSKDPAYEKLNNSEEYRKFISLYFTIGNLIPIWPGGNEARGKMGVYDMPEIFFGKYIEYTNVLKKQYEETNLDEVIEPKGIIVCRRKEDGIKILIGKKEVSNIKDLKDEMKKDNALYLVYLNHRNEVISKRKEKLEKYLLQNITQ